MSRALSLAAVGQPDRAPPGDVVADLADRPDRVLQREVAHDHARLDHPQHEVAVTPTLSSVVVSLMFESPTMTCSRR